MKRLLDNNAGSLTKNARKSGEASARKLFAARGNNSEVHLNEYELALACAAAAQVAINLTLNHPVTED